MSRVIRIQFDPIAGLGNNLFHYLLANVIRDHVPDAVLVGDRLPEWVAPHSKVTEETRSPEQGDPEIIELYGHVIPLRTAIERLRSSDNIEICTRSLALRMEYFGRHLELARRIFAADVLRSPGFGDDHIVFSIRCGDIYRGAHPNYTLLPISFYQYLVRKTGLKPAFVGQIEDNDYCHALREVFPAAPFCHGSPMEDFLMLRTSSCIVLSISTFSWLAAWLSESARLIICPILGMFNPLDRPDIDLLPVDDARYRFYRFPSEQWTGTDAEIAAKIAGRPNFRRVVAPRLFKSAALLRAWQEGRLPPGLSLRRSLGSVFP